MLRIVVLGSTGPLGRWVVENALLRGHFVTAVARNPSVFDDFKVTLEPIAEEEYKDRFVVKKWDATSADSQSTAKDILSGQDAVISCLGVRSLWSPSTVISQGIENLVKAMHTLSQDPSVEKAPKRLIQVSSWGTQSEPHDGWFFRWVVLWMLKHVLDDHRRAEQFIQRYAAESWPELEWNVVRPPGLTYGPFTGRIRRPGKEAPEKLDFDDFGCYFEVDKGTLDLSTQPKTEDGRDKLQRISRQNVSNFLLCILEHPELVPFKHNVAICGVSPAKA